MTPLIHIKFTSKFKILLTVQKIEKTKDIQIDSVHKCIICSNIKIRKKVNENLNYFLTI